jgi:hypothetical protein
MRLPLTRDRTDVRVPGGPWQTVAMASKDLQLFDSTQPQTLQGAVMLCYINAVFGLIGLLTGGILSLLLLAEAVAGVAIANNHRWGYYLGVGLAGVYLVAELMFFVLLPFNISIILNLAFAAILVVMLLHTQSREYQRLWFH